MKQYSINRTALMMIVESAIEKGRQNIRWYCGNISQGLEQFYIESIRDAMRNCEGVDFGCFQKCYGCPITQANLRGGYGIWFTMPFDTMMREFIEPEPSLESGWAVKVED